MLKIKYLRSPKKSSRLDKTKIALGAENYIEIEHFPNLTSQQNQNISCQKSCKTLPKIVQVDVNSNSTVDEIVLEHYMNLCDNKQHNNGDSMQIVLFSWGSSIKIDKKRPFDVF